jgi:AhpD family alkylhydroperoxidase
MNLFRVLVRHPELMRRVNALGGLFMAHGSLPVREREMVILRVAWNSGCAYEFAQHAPIALRSGLSEEEIRELGQPVDVGAWEESDRGILQLADEIMARLEVTNATWDLVSRSHSDEQMMELVILTGFYQMLAAFLKTARVPLDEGSLGFPET